jgi:penicillin-binding protein 1C
MTARRIRTIVSRAAMAVLALLAAFAVALVLTAVRTPLPAALTGGHMASSLEVGDRDGKLVREVRAEGAMLAREVRLADLSKNVVPALLAAEDARFFHHVGIDPLSIVRAAVQAIWQHHVVSGASTITQQLARTVALRPRTFRGKLREMALALRIEASLSKTRILEEYLSRVEFGPGVRGIDAASRWYFDKPASELSLAESAALVGIPRGPSLYDPRRSLVPVTRRRDRILRRMNDRGLSDTVAVERALATPVVLQPHFAEGGVEHLALGLAHGTIPSGLPPDESYRRIDTTLDGTLQREIEVLSRRAARDVLSHDATALAAIVVENATGEVLAYVGSPDYFEHGHGGANDGVRALRQPGSTLKPFVYAAAMEGLGMTAATLLPDIDLTLQTAEGPYRPKNYDGRTHGPVRLRQALASSLNVPAVLTAEQVGPGTVLSLLRRAGFSSLDGAATHYGAAIALGDGEVRLEELAGAYAMLARGGERVPLSLVRRAWTTGGRPVEPLQSAVAPTRVIDARTASVLTDVLADAAARASAFGRGNALELPFAVAAKTGTSKGYRDNWTVGFTHEVTVAVWVGNFDGSPMTGSTGVTGAGPLFHDVMLAAMRGRAPAPLVDHAGLVDVEVCALSGERPGPGCTHRTHELFRPSEVPNAACTMHVTVRVDPSNGLLATPACSNAVERTFEAYPPRYLAWAVAARRPVVPEGFSPRCPGVSRPKVSTTQVATVRFPDDGAKFAIDPAGPVRQEIVLAARPGPEDHAVRFVLDGRPLGVVRAPFELPWQLVPGRHRLVAETLGGDRTDAVTFEVADAR